ncbi:MAG TPA: SHOCT domain-containing protein [Euryarchaeota archaeon]|nr:SHOCT domain-containing protein [Euryarchaeota archaeon]
MGGSWGFGMGLGLIFWVIVILAIYYFLSESENGGHEETAMEILKKRFARGEINKEEYEDMEKKLGI